MSAHNNSSLPLYVRPDVGDYGLEPDEFMILARVVRFGGWSGGYSKETIRNIAERTPGIEYRRAEYVLKFLVAANVIEQVVEKGHRLGWRPRQPKCWLNPDELDTVRTTVYTNRKQPEAKEAPASTNVTPIREKKIMTVPRPEALPISDEMMSRIENDFPCAAAQIISHKIRFHSHYSKPHHNQATNESEIPTRTLTQWQGMFMEWMERQEAWLVQKQKQKGGLNATSGARGVPGNSGNHSRKIADDEYDWQPAVSL
ncbi:MAG: hypothetical protein ABI977_12950 [Acidobacteriota bacterium]